MTETMAATMTATMSDTRPTGLLLSSTHETPVEPMSTAEPAQPVVGPLLNRPQPSIAVERYAREACKLAVGRQEAHGAFYLEVPLLPGVWADGPDLRSAFAELESVIVDWALLKLDDDDDDIPVIGGIDLVRPRQR